MERANKNWAYLKVNNDNLVDNKTELVFVMAKLSVPDFSFFSFFSILVLQKI